MDFDSCWQKHQGLCQEIIDEINKIRKSPKSFVQYLDAYIENTEDWKIKRGNMYDFNDKLVSMRPSERSIFYATSCGVELTELEYQAILNYDKDDADKSAKWHTEDLGQILKIGNMLAMIEEK